MHILLRLSALLLAPLMAMPATAQDTPSIPSPSDPHAALIDAIQANADMDAIMANVLAETNRQFRNEPIFVEIEEQSPGTINALLKAMSPVLLNMQQRIQRQYRPNMIENARAVFTAEEAQGLADFYGSDIGRRFLQSLSQNYAVDNALDGVVDESVDNILAGKENEIIISEEDILRDQQATIVGTIGSMSAQELAEVGDALRDVSAIEKMSEFSQRILPIQVKMENEQPTPEEQRALEKAIEAVFAERFE